MRTNFHTQPAALAEAVRSDNIARPPAKLVLGLDLGSTTGYCYAWLAPGVTISPKLISRWHMGQWDLSAGSYDSGAIRFVKLRRFLAAMSPDLVVYEDVKAVFGKHGAGPSVEICFSRGASAGELIGAFKATLATWCEECGVPCTGFPIGAIKKRLTGKGNANKEQMIEAANELFGAQLEVEGYEATGADNVADAAACLLLGLEHYADGLPGMAQAE
jgi:Holliday junction resolvasome RuvABC endonuclease subunit